MCVCLYFQTTKGIRTKLSMDLPWTMETSSTYFLRGTPTRGAFGKNHIFGNCHLLL